MKDWIINYWWFIWGVLGAVIYIRHNIKSNGGKFKLRKNPETYSDTAIIKRIKIVAFGLILIVAALFLVKVFI
jgi:hypothetical protein